MSRRALSSLVALTIVLAGAAHADPMSLAWDQCLSEGGTHHKYFACDTNARYEVLVGSFVPQQPMADFMGLVAVVDGQTADQVSLPDWWQLYNAGSCRQTALSCSFDFLSSPNVSCTDPWQGQAGGGVAAYYTAAYPPPSPLPPTSSRALQIKVGGALASPVPLPAGTEYYAFRLTLSHAKSKGVDACTGCTVGLCLLLDKITLYPQSGPTVTLYADHVQPSDPYAGTEMATWECADGRAYGSEGFNFACVAVQNCSVPVRNRTWGSIKALYR